MPFRDALCRLCSCALVGKSFYICKLLLNVLSLNDCVYLLEEEQQESEFWRKNKIKANGEGNNELFHTQPLIHKVTCTTYSELL